VLDADGSTRPARTPITLHHLLTHTSGLTYDFLHPPDSAIASAYRDAAVDFMPTAPGNEEAGALRRHVERLATCPLLCEPGTEFHYGLSLDVLGCVLETVSGMRLGDLLEREVFAPLGMVDTGFFVPASKHGRFAACYELLPEGVGFQPRPDAPTEDYRKPCYHMCRGGGGLVSTLRDFMRFTSMLAGLGACPSTAPGGASPRVLSRTAVRFMMSDHLPPSVSVPPGFLHARDGMGFGIGGSVVREAARNALVGATYSWGNMANGYMCIDPAEELAFVMLTQVTPSFKLCYWRRELQSLVQACVDDD
jgi:CubicO group peptidase (beta-lactamase class C family)